MMLAVGFVGTQQAAAQSFLEALFGIAKPPPPAAPQRTLTVPTDAPMRVDRFHPEQSIRSTARDRDDGWRSQGRLQAMCVRACDGYYWPLRYPASQRDAKDDEAQCQTACGSETRLYYRSGPHEDAEAMRDLNGKSYGASDTAFAYRRG